jgi:hypothetical protein
MYILAYLTIPLVGYPRNLDLFPSHTAAIIGRRQIVFALRFSSFSYNTDEKLFDHRGS